MHTQNYIYIFKVPRQGMEFKSGNALIYFKIELSGIDENVGWSKDFLFLCMCVMHTCILLYETRMGSASARVSTTTAENFSAVRS
jgi:hypothetical protein